MTLHGHPTPLHPPLSSVLELDEYLRKRMDSLWADCFDDETLGHIGLDKHNRSMATYNALQDVWLRIGRWVATERVEAEQTAEGDRLDAAYKSTYGAGPDGRMAQWQAEDR